MVAEFFEVALGGCRSFLLLVTKKLLSTYKIK